MSGDAETLITALDRAGHRLTGPRRTVAELIARRDGHFSAADLIDDAQRRHPRIGRATIFRTLDLLTDVGAVERVDLPDGGHAYVGCELTHHHHVICTRCGRSTEVRDGGLRDVTRDIERVSGYRVTSHRIELFGVCPDCLAINAADA